MNCLFLLPYPQPTSPKLTSLLGTHITEFLIA